MPNNVRRSPQTERDLREIWQHIAENSTKAADAMLDRIEHVFDMLADYPKSGRGRPELTPRLRSFPAESYIVFYFSVADGIEVVRVMHAQRDITPKDMPSTHG